jgi:hypothetical protein
MAELDAAINPSLASSLPSPSQQIVGLVCGEAIANGDFVYIKGSDGRVYKATGAAANEAALVVGIVFIGNGIGEPVTIWHHVNASYTPAVSATAKAPGVPLYLSGTNAGRLADAASTGGLTPIAFVIDTQRIFVKGNY